MNAFLTGVCPICRVPWPTVSREDLTLLDHRRLAKPGEEPLRRLSNGSPIVDCEGSGVTLIRSACGENEDPRFWPGGEDAEERGQTAADARRIQHASVSAGNVIEEHLAQKERS